MSFIHAYFWNKKIKADDFDDLRTQISDFKPSKVSVSVKSQHWKKNSRDNINFDLHGSFLDIDKELRVLQKKFGKL